MASQVLDRPTDWLFVCHSRVSRLEVDMNRTKMCVATTGGRTYENRSEVARVLRTLQYKYGKNLVIAHGDANGADKLVGALGEKEGIEIRRYPAQWHEHDREGITKVKCICNTNSRICRAAGVRRNQMIVDLFAPDLLIAFPGNDGTRDMMGRCSIAKVPIINLDQPTMFSLFDLLPEMPR